MYLKALFRNKLFVAGSFILLTFLLCSFYYTFELKEDVPAPYRYLYNDEGSQIGEGPFPPSLEFPFGTDKMGHSLFYMIIDGAKYTILLSILVGAGRVLIGLLLGFILQLLPPSIKEWFRGLFEGMHYLPLSLFTYMLAAPIFVFTWSFGEKSAFYGPIIIIILLSTPVIGVYLSDEIARIYHKEFIVNARIMGGSWWHIFKTHVRPYFLPQLFIVLLQQIVQVLIIFAHLGILGVFLGGNERKEVDANEFTGIPVMESFSSSNEWGGLIAKYFSDFIANPNLVLWPVLFFALTILSLNFIIEGLKNVFVDENIKVKGKKIEVDLGTGEDVVVPPFSLVRDYKNTVNM